MQPVEVYEQIKKDGYYKFDSTKAENYKDFKNSYSWLEQQMNIRGIIKENSCDGLVWAWHTYNKKHKKPDLRHSGFGYKDEESVCLEIEKPDDKVLLSDYDLWHYVLNGWWLDKSTCEKEWDKNHEWLNTLDTSERNRIIEESWKDIFNIYYYESDWILRGAYVQATFYGLELEDIKKVQYFKCR
jgi:hypothetical protein